MKKIILVFAFILLAMPLFAQVGYWYKTEFIELSPKNDSVYYLSFRDKSANNKQKISEKGECINIMAQFNDYQFLVKKPSNLDIKDCYFSPKYEAKAIGGEMVILPQLIMSVKNKEVLSSILNRYSSGCSYHS